jgi:hypothetical protein
MRLLLTILLLATLGAKAQQIGQNAPAGGSDTVTLSVRSQIVIETVVVKDKKGNPIDGLTAKDFTLTEDGVPQTIRFCEQQSLPSPVSDVPVIPTEPEDIKLYKRLART